jgi:hypothetical protein
VLLRSLIELQRFLSTALNDDTHGEGPFISPTVKFRRTAKNSIGGMLRGDVVQQFFVVGSR